MGSSSRVAVHQNSKSNNITRCHTGGRQNFPQFRNPPMFNAVFGVAHVDLQNCAVCCMFAHAMNRMIEGHLACTPSRRICCSGFMCGTATTTTTNWHVCTCWTTRLQPMCIPFQSVANCGLQWHYFGGIQKGIPTPIPCMSPSTFASLMCIYDVIDDWGCS